MSQVKRTMSANRITKRTLQYFFLSVTTIVIMFPLWYTLVLSFDTPQQSTAYPPHFFFQGLNWDSFAAAFRGWPVGEYMFNTLYMTVMIVVLQAFISSIAAYAFAFIRCPNKGAIFFLFLSTTMISADAMTIANYMTIDKLGLLNTYTALIIPFIASAGGAFLLRQQFMAIPKELFDSARMDGCGHFRYYITVVLPLARSVIITMSIGTFLGAYNQYMWPLLVTTSEHMRTIQVGIKMAMGDMETVWYNQLFALSVISCLPTAIMMVFLHKYLLGRDMAGTKK